MKKSILITFLSALLLSLFAVSILPALSLYGKMYTHISIYSWCSEGEPFGVTQISKYDKLIGAISSAVFPWLPEPPSSYTPSFSNENLNIDIIIRESGIEREFTLPQKEKSQEINPSNK